MTLRRRIIARAIYFPIYLLHLSALPTQRPSASPRRYPLLPPPHAACPLQFSGLASRRFTVLGAVVGRRQHPASRFRAPLWTRTAAGIRPRRKTDGEESRKEANVGGGFAAFGECNVARATPLRGRRCTLRVHTLWRILQGTKELLILRLNLTRSQCWTCNWRVAWFIQLLCEINFNMPIFFVCCR